MTAGRRSRESGKSLPELLIFMIGLGLVLMFFVVPLVTEKLALERRTALLVQSLFNLFWVALTIFLHFRTSREPAPAPPPDVVVQERDGEAVLQVDRQNWHVLGEKVRNLVESGRHSRIVVDWAELHHIDALGLAPLVRAVEMAHAAGVEVRFEHTTKPVRETLVATGVAPLFGVLAEAEAPRAGNPS